MTNNKDDFKKLLEKNPNMMAHFVQGAPSFLTSNINCLRGLANGTSAHLAALHWDNTSVESDVIAYLSQQTGDVVLPKGMEPSNILVRPVVSERLRTTWPKEATCVAGDIIIPVPQTLEKDTIRNDNGTLSVKITKPQVELGFITTVHKAQGATLDRVVASLLDRPGNPSREDFFSLYVILTRVRQGSHFRVILEPGDNLDWLDDIQPPNDLVAFMSGYDPVTRKWSRERAQSKLATLPVQNKSPKRKKRQEKGIGSPIKRRKVEFDGDVEPTNNSPENNTGTSRKSPSKKITPERKDPMKDKKDKEGREIHNLRREFPNLSEEQIQQFLLTGRNTENDVIARLQSFGSHNIDSVKRGSLRRLRPGKWLNDELMSFYITHLSHRELELCRQDPNRLRCFFFKAYFFTKLMREARGVTPHYDYDQVSTWTNSVPGANIFHLDRLFIPVNIDNGHWALVVTSFGTRSRERPTIEYYDSGTGRHAQYYMDIMLRYLGDEWRRLHPGGVEFDSSAWTRIHAAAPTQENGYDCGVFTLYFADYLSRGEPLSLTQSDMEAYRERIALEVFRDRRTVDMT